MRRRLPRLDDRRPHPPHQVGELGGARLAVLLFGAALDVEDDGEEPNERRHRAASAASPPRAASTRSAPPRRPGSYGTVGSGTPAPRRRRRRRRRRSPGARQRPRRRGRAGACGSASSVASTSPASSRRGARARRRRRRAAAAPPAPPPACFVGELHCSTSAASWRSSEKASVVEAAANLRRSGGRAERVADVEGGARREEHRGGNERHLVCLICPSRVSASCAAFFWPRSSAPPAPRRQLQSASMTTSITSYSLASPSPRATPPPPPRTSPPARPLPPSSASSRVCPRRSACVQ